MREDECIWAVKELLLDYVKSPSLRHIRDPYSLTKLAQEIVRRIDRGNSIWRKWDGQREVLTEICAVLLDTGRGYAGLFKPYARTSTYDDGRGPALKGL
jgi:hypothetical protein